MHSFATLGPAASTNWISPGIRRIGFAEDPAQFTVTHLLIHGWGVARPKPDPCPDPPTGDFAAWGREVGDLDREAREGLPRDEDQVSVNTPWREQIYYMWNHVFYDVGNWVSSAYGTRRFMPPGIEVFTIKFPAPTANRSESNGNGDADNDANEDKNKNKSLVPASSKVWPDSETLLAPAYLAPGISIRVETLEPGQAADEETFHPGNFEQGDRYCVWYVKKGLQLRLFVEGEWDEKDVGGLAAVMVCGSMTGDPIVPESSEEEEDEEGGADEDGENGDKEAAKDGDDAK
ncbi:hypothetical protein BJY01DRAFT_253004 [Aspergillus pseudoustus]|uniref:Uncharacterized protein n=1 Tax=Aspergillus pseudoustus TaxID=1810923 RepID=A0ABR4J3M2_9EURO